MAFHQKQALCGEEQTAVARDRSEVSAELEGGTLLISASSMGDKHSLGVRKRNTSLYFCFSLFSQSFMKLREAQKRQSDA